jgi:predicted PurR-regulated permease PerM
MKKIFNAAAEKIREIRQKRDKYEKTQKDHESGSEHHTIVQTHQTETLQIEISTATVVKVLLVIVLFFAATEILVQLKSILTISIISFFLALSLAPIVEAIENFRFSPLWVKRLSFKKSWLQNFWKKFRFPTPIAILILYVGFIGALALLFVRVIPVLAEQLLDIAYDARSFFTNSTLDIPFLEKLGISMDSNAVQQFLTDNLAAISRNLQSVAGSTFSILSGIFQGVFNLIFSLVLMFFILMERDQIGTFILALFPPKDRQYIHEKTKVVQAKMSQWFRAQVILMISMGLFMYAGMKTFEWIFGMKYAATIGLLAAFMELFPYIGAFATGLLTILIAINISWVLVAVVIGWYSLAQFLEGNVLIPIIMEKVVGLSSVAVLLAIAIGGILGNAIGGVAMAVIGMILAVPIAASISIFVQEYVQRDESHMPKS